MNYVSSTNSTQSETAVTFASGESQLLGIAHHSATRHPVGVLLVVGGPQYRVGSHRQFVQLSRALANQQIPSFRFDYTGMGDSEGDKKNFDSICADIRSACDAMCKELGVEKVVIWGLCDAASAAMIYAPTDPRVIGMLILNPWLRSDAAMGKTMLKYYYVQRLFSKGFWQKLLTGKVNVGASIGDAKGFVKDSVSQQQTAQDTYQARMQSGLKSYTGKICLILSGVDLTAKEFAQQTLNSKSWRVLKSPQTTIHRIDKADHTFSSSAFKREVEEITVQFVNQVQR